MAIRYPIGVRPLLIEETARRRRAEARIVSALEGAGFAEVILPIIDYAEPYDVNARQSYRFVDRDGELVLVRSDFTPMVARALAPSLTPEQLPLRVYYRGDVIRCEPSRLGAKREMFQAGAEILGDSSVEADVEVMTLVASILRELGITPLIVYTDGTIPERLATSRHPERSEGSPPPRSFADAQDDVREILAAKRSGIGGIIGRLAEGTATLDELREVLPDVAARLESIGRAAGADCVLHLDDVDRGPGYYTGLRFRAYDSATRNVLAQGGRYDSLYGRFGNAAPAVGFTLTIDDL